MWVAVPKNYSKLPIQRIVVASFVLEVVGVVPAWLWKVALPSTFPPSDGEGD